MCPYLELFYSVFSVIWTEYRKILPISPYSVRMWGITDRDNSQYGHLPNILSGIVAAKVLDMVTDTTSVVTDNVLQILQFFQGT